MSLPNGEPPSASAPRSGAQSRRAHVRASVGLEAIVHEIGADNVVGPGLPGRTFDLSRGGVGLLLKRMIHPGKTMAIFIALPGKPRSVYFGEVRSCVYVPDGQMYQVGVQFIPAPTAKPVKQWLEAQQAQRAA